MKGIAMLCEVNNNTLTRLYSNWDPMEVEVENLIMSSFVNDENILDESIFGEPLFVVSNQVKTRNSKIADILAIDRYGSGVIIELKRKKGMLGVETQALQYLADFSAYQGDAFIERFSKDYKNKDLKIDIGAFLGGNASFNDLNKKSRIILLAMDFDPTIYSMGEWLSNHKVAFRCIKYTPVKINDRQFISFSVAFDRSTEILNPLIFNQTMREPGYFWHNIADNDPKWWKFLIVNKQIPACFDNAPGDQGEKLLRNYIVGDTIIAYAKNYGAIGFGVIKKTNSYKLVKENDEEDRLNGRCRHRLSIEWKAFTLDMKQGMKAREIREEFGIYHPISTSVTINSDKAKKLIDALSNRWESHTIKMQMKNSEEELVSTKLDAI
jgi:hypothetical protein